MARERTEVEELQDYFSDYHKDVYGWRPRFGTDAEWNSAEWLKQQIQLVSDAWPAIEAQERARENNAILQFEASVASCLATGAKSYDDAIVWLKQAAGSETDPYLKFDQGYFEHCMGLPYGHLDMGPKLHFPH